MVPLQQADLFDRPALSPALIAAQHPEIFPPEFTEWLTDNGHVWDYFVNEAKRIIARGFKHYSARTIIHVMRHHSAIEEKGGLWKVNNNHSPYLARLFDLMYPAHAGLWEYRETKKVTQDKQ